MVELKLSEKLKQVGMTAYRLAQLTEIHETQIGRLKNGKAKGITFDTLDRLCEALNCEPADLLVRNKIRGKKSAAKEKSSTKLKAHRRLPPIAKADEKE